MGHKRQRKTLSLTFDDEPGLEILMRSCTVRKFLWAMRAIEQMSGGGSGMKLPDQEIEEFTEWFAGRILSWNLEDDDDKPIPVTADYLLDEDIDWTAKVAMGWVSGVLKLFNIPFDLASLAKLADLGRQGAAGTGMEASIPMSPVTPASATGT